MQTTLAHPATDSATFLEVEGGKPLAGQVALPGAKNAALPAIVAACLSDEPTVLRNVPTGLNDVKLLIQLLTSVGASVREVSPGTLVCSGRGWRGGAVDGERASSLRHSLLLLGASAFWRAAFFLPFPGGCQLGSRKHDLHTLALSALGFEVREDASGIGIAPGRTPDGAEVAFHYPTFGGTLNALFASVNLPTTTRIKNAARNPEVLDVIALLGKMGAAIRWLDATTLEVRGVAKLSGAEHRVMSDRIIASTLIAATAVTEGHTFIQNADAAVLGAETEVWRRAGLALEGHPGGIEVRFKERLTACDVTTRAYPGFHTDIQPLHAVMMTLAAGQSRVKETILDGRFRYALELNKMGALTRTEAGDFTCVNGAPGQVLHIDGVSELQGAEVEATDIRGGAAVVVAGLAATGVTRVSNLYQLERGYSNLGDLLTQLGATVRRRS